MIIYVKSTSRALGLAAVFLVCGCASVLDEDGALAIAPYTIEKNGRIVIEARVNDQGPFDFALDTAASISAVFDELRYELELKPIPGKLAIIHGAVATGEYPLLDIDRIEVGREDWTDARIVSLPGDTLAGTTIDGVLGVDFLRKYAVGFSTRARVVRLYPPRLVARRAYRGWASVPLEAESIGETGATVYTFEIEIDGRRIPAVFDLGAGLNLMNWPAAQKLGIEPTDSRDDDLVSGALESTPAAARLETDEVTTASIRWRNEVFLIADLEIFSILMPDEQPAVILGAGFFTQRDFVIDFVRNRLLVKVAMDEVNVDYGITVQ